MSSPSKAARPLARHGFAVLLTGLALLVQGALYPYTHATSLLLCSGAVMLAGWRGGAGPGFTAMVLSALGLDYFFLPPVFHFSLEGKNAATLLLFLLLSTCITLLNERARRAQGQAETQQERLRRLFLRAPALVNTYLGPDHRCDIVHPLTYSLLGAPFPLEGRSLRDLVAHERGRHFLEALDRVYRTGEPFVGKALPTTPAREGEQEIYLDVTFQPMHDLQGRIEGVMTFAVDVTAEVLARRQLEASETRLRMATDVAGVGIWEADLLTQRTWHNAQCDRIFGYAAPVPEWSRERFIEHIHPEDREWVPQALSRGATAPGGEFELEFRVVWPEGGIHWVVTRNRVLHDASGTLVKMMGTTLDITARKQTEQALERAVRLRDEFLSVAAHELKTPLTPLSLKLQTLTRALSSAPDSPDTERRRKDLEVMRRQVQRLTALVTNLLDVSRIGIGRLNLQLEPVDLAVLVREVASRLAPEAERVGSPLELELAGAWVGRWDPLRLEQVVENLLSNALKYGAGRAIHVRVVEGGEDQVRLVVRDEGIGIAPEALGRIFDRFERAVSERHYGGLGLGLYITREIVSALGGTVRVESALGEGATFTVALPREPPALAS